MLTKFERFKKFISIYAKKVLGVVLIIGGIIGLFLPFLQGILMIGAGVILLGNHSLIAKVRQLGQRLKFFWDRCLAGLHIRRK